MPSQTVRAPRAVPDAAFQSSELPGRQRVRSRAPLRLGLAGGGTDVSPYCDRFGGVVLNATIDRYCYTVLEERRDGKVELVGADLGLGGELTDADDIGLALHAAVYRRITKDFGLGHPALTMTTMSEVPPGSGLGSSSTLVVSMIEALREYFGLPLGEYDVARMAYDVERHDCGLVGGRQDQYAATFGGFNMMEFSAGERAVINPLRLKSAVVHELEASLVLFHTGVSRASADIIERQASAIEGDSEEELKATHALRREAVAMKEAILVGDFERMAAILRGGWEAKKRLATGITSEAIDAAFNVALTAGAHAGKVSGAGGGGFVIFLVEPTRRPEVAQALESQPGGSVDPVHFVDEGAVAWTVR